MAFLRGAMFALLLTAVLFGGMYLILKTRPQHVPIFFGSAPK